LRPLTSVRGLFAWGVVLYHFRLSCRGWLPEGAIHALSKGYLAVDFFFLLSGFVIWLNYGERLCAGGGTADFLVRRLARIWPLHAAMLGFALLLAGLLAATGRPAPQFPMVQFPLHLLMIQEWGLTEALTWNDPAWSISCEWAAYLLVPVAALLLPKRRMPDAAVALAALLPLLPLHAAMAAEGSLGQKMATYGVLRCLCEFACGAALSVLWRRWRGSLGAELGGWALGAAALGAWGAGAPETLAVPLGFAGLLLGLALGAERPGHPLAGRAIHFLGEISYATYLSHFLLFFAFKLALVRDPLNVPPAMMAGFLLFLAAASAALYLGVERPAQRMILRWWRARGERRRFAPAT
jgi:peptidoglycan/LPS O-acetylase OafA/YrhL